MPNYRRTNKYSGWPFFGMPDDNEQYVSRRVMLREKVRKYYGNHEPVLSYVSQPPLNGGLILEAHTYTPDEGDHITYKHIGTFPYVVLVNGAAVSCLPEVSMAM